MTEAFRRAYGAGAGHLLAVLATLAFAGAVFVRFVDAGPLDSLALWLGGAIVLHDLVLFPVYALADRGATAAARATRARGLPNPVNYLRFPTLLSGLTLLLSFPLVLREADRYPPTTGRSLDPYLGRWLALSAAAFAAAAMLYAIRAARARRRTDRGGEL